MPAGDTELYADYFLSFRGPCQGQSRDITEIPFAPLMSGRFRHAVLRELEAFTKLSNNATQQLIFIYVKRLSDFLSENLYLEFNSHRSVKLQLSGTQDGVFEDFLRYFELDGWKRFLERFPQARFLIGNFIRQCRNFLSLLDASLITDCPVLVSEGMLEKDADVVELEQLSDDFHYDGKCVLLLRFQTDERIVFKPRNGFFEAFAHKLVRDKLDHFFVSKCIFPKCISMEDRSYSKYLKPEPFEKKFVDTYYYSVGQTLFLLQTLQATDIHYENVLAGGKHLYVVDLETCSYPLLMQELSVLEQSPSDLAIQETLSCSVLAIGLLPSALQTNPDHFVRMGGLEKVERRRTERSYSFVNTDGMRSAIRTIRSGFQNVPHMRFGAATVENYSTPLLEGYRSLRDHFHQNGALFKSIIRTFNRRCPSSRYVLRPTALYDQIISHQLTVDMSRSREEVRRSIKKHLQDVSPGPLWSLDRLAEKEVSSIEVGDIPTFHAQYSSRHLFDNSSELVAPNAFSQSPGKKLARSYAINRRSEIKELNESAARAVLRMHDGKSKENKPCFSDLSELSIAAAEKICSCAVATGNHHSWIVATSSGSNTAPVIQSAGSDLYSGNIGISIALASVYAATGDPKYVCSIKSAIRHITDISENPNRVREYAKRFGFGGFEGLGSIIYGLSLLSEFLDDVSMLESAFRIVESADKDSIRNERRIDIVAGVSGFLLALLSLEKCLDRQMPLSDNVAEVLHRRLASYIERQEFGMSTCIATGVSHGLSGIALALARFGKARDSTRWFDAALAALRREDESFIAQERNWKDGRLHSIANPSTWCHGSLGINTARAEIRGIVGTTHEFIHFEPGFSFDRTTDHLCCGNLGDIECALTYAKKTGNSEVREQAFVALMNLANRAGRDTIGSWPNGVERFSPSMLSGLAGLIYTVERSKNERNPSVLFLEPVRTEKGTPGER